MNKIYLIITLILIMVAGFYFLSQVQFKKEKPQIVYEENVDIDPVIKTRPLSAKSFSVRYKNISFAITDIRFSSFEQAKSFVEEFIGYIQNNNFTNFTVEKINFDNMECYKAESNNPPQRGIILQKDEKVLLFLGYTTNIEYVKDIVKWFIGEKK